jgi:TonB-dependent receptor
VRDGQAAAFQFKTADEKALFTLQYLRSSTKSDSTEYTVEIGSDLSEYNTFPKGCNASGQCAPGFQNYTYDSNNLFTSGYITLPANGWRGANAGGRVSGANGATAGGMQFTQSKRSGTQTVTNQDIGFNAKLNPTDHWQIDLDFDYTKSEKTNLDVTLYGSSFADAYVDLRGNLPNVVFHKPQDLTYSWATPDPALVAQTDSQYFASKSNQFWRSAMDHSEDSKGEQYAVRGDVTYKFDPGSFLKSIKAGVRVTNKTQNVRYSTYNWGMLSEVWSGSNPVTVANVGGSNVSRYDFPDFFRGQAAGPAGAYYYNGDMVKDYAGFVNFARSVQNYYVTNNGGSPTWNPLALRPGAVNGYLPSEVQPLKERDFNAYIQANFATDAPIFGDVRFSGNAGVRYVRTNVESIGSIGIRSAATLLGTNAATGLVNTYDQRCPVPTLPPGAPAGTPLPVQTGLCTVTPAAFANLATFAGNGATLFDRGSSSYNYLLPSANIKFGIGSDKIIRLAASRVMTRPQNDYLRNFYDVNLTGATLTSQSGNPTLKPALAWQFDITAEWYFSRVGSLTLDAFYKTIDNFFYQEVSSRSITNNGITQSVSNRGPANYNGQGKIKGFEVAYQQTFDFLPKPLNSLGFSGNYTYIESEGLPNSFLNGGSLANVSSLPKGNLPLEQLSKHNVNAQLFYETSNFSIRAAYSWRSRFLLTAADVIFPYYSIFNEATGQLDGSIFFNLNKNIRVGVQGVNLLNEVTKTTQAYTGSPDLLAPRSYFMNDRRYSFVARATF